jgi:hypothetical protein
VGLNGESADVSTLAASSEGGGAALDQVIGMTLVGAVVSAALVWIGYLHRNRRITWLTRLSEAFGRRFSRPPWVALPIAMFIATIICALFGFIWDVSLHIGNGRDPGPLANPAHYFILVGLFGMFVSGMVAVVLPHDKPGPAAVRITRNWYAPVGGILMAGCGLYALIGFPLDDVWHRIFGQDVTLWGPTHLMMIGGAGFATLTALYLEYEGKLATPPEEQQTEGVGLKFIQYLGFAGVIIGMSVFQIEFDFGVPQFRLVFQPMLITAAAVFALVAARMVLGRGAAVAAAVVAVGLRGGVALIVGPIFGAPINWFALYLGPAFVVEVLGLTPLIKRPLLYGAVSGLGIATAGLWLESLWIANVYHYPWPMSIWPEALAMTIPVAIFVGLCGAMVGMVLIGRRLPRKGIGIGIVVAAVLVIGGAVANGLQYRVPKDAIAAVTLTEMSNVNGRKMVQADVRITPPNLISADPEWVSILSWQGKLANNRGIVVDRLQRVGPGQYRSTQPIPVWGSWKSVLRVQDGKTMAGVSIFLAADPGINKPAEGVAAGRPDAKSIFGARHFEPEINILQRERTFNHPAWLWTLGCLIVLACTLVLIGGLTWGAGRINNSETPMNTDAEDRPRVQA